MTVSLGSRVATFAADVDTIHKVAHGDTSTIVPTENGAVRSVAKLIADNQAYIDASLNLPTVKAIVLAMFGQSNAAGGHNGGPNPASANVAVWDGTTDAWGSSDYTQAPLSRGYPDGNHGNNNIGLALAHRLAAENPGAKIYVIYDAWGGRPIEDWIGSGTASVRYASIKAKIEAALKSPELASVGKTTIDCAVWAQGEANGLTDTYADHLAKFTTLDRQLRAESWMTPTTPMLVMGMSGLHTRYQVWQAQLDYCENVNRACIYVNSSGLKTSYDVTAAMQVNVNNTASFNVGDTVTTSTATGSIVAVGTSVLSIGNVTGIFQAGPITSSSGGSADITAVVEASDYTHWLGDSLWEHGYHRAWYALRERGMSHRHQVSLFYGRGTGPLRTGSVAIATFRSLVSQSSATSTFPLNASGAVDCVSWGYQCTASNNSLAGGYQSTQDTLARYGLLWGRSLGATSGADYHAGFGFQNTLGGAYTMAAGRGHTVADPYCTALGSFSKYKTALADPAILQIGCGTSSITTKNALTVFQSGLVQFNGNVDFEADNKFSLGTASQRASVIYAASGVINTSDARTKQKRGALSAAELAAWSKVQPCIYQFLESINEKGEDSARLHAGLIAQEVMQAFQDEGLDPASYALFCEDEVFVEDMELQTVTTSRQKTQPGTVPSIDLVDGKPVLTEKATDVLLFETLPVVDADGEPVLDPESGEPLTYQVPVIETVQEQVHVPVLRSIGTRYGLRYTECLIFEAAYLRSIVTGMDERITALEAANVRKA